MKNTVLTVVFSLLSTGCAMYSLVYPAWFQQHYHRDGKDVFQSYGIFAFQSTDSLESPFYASQTTLQYSDFCDSTTIPNYMLGDGEQFHRVLCGKAMHSIKATASVGAAISIVGLIVSIVAVYNPNAGYAEKIVSGATLIGSILLAVSLVIWGWAVQQRLYQVDSINSAYTSCKADKKNWSCWFYGYSFWVCLAGVILMSVAGYMSSAGRAEKIRYFRKEYERDLAVAMQASMEHDAAAQSHHVNGHTPNNAAYGRANTGNYNAPPPNQQYPYQQQQQYPQQHGVYDASQGGYQGQQRPMDGNSTSYHQQNQPLEFDGTSAAYGKQRESTQKQKVLEFDGTSASYHPQPVEFDGSSVKYQQHPNQRVLEFDGTTAYPSQKEERFNHTLLGRQPSGGVV